MESIEAKNRAIENAREPIRREVYDLISKKISEHTNVLESDLIVKYYIPFKWEVKTLERRKTVEGEEKVIFEQQISCPELDWLLEELKQKKYVVVLKEESGYVYGKNGFLEISTQ